MRLFLLSALTMGAFAANSILNRLALIDGGIDPASFAAVRLLSGVAVLWALAAMTGPANILRFGDWRAAVALFTYIFGFSFAYLTLDAGLGALILFGMVQITMFGGALWGGERPPAHRWIGTGLAFGGLAWLLWPGGDITISPVHAAYMILAGVGWGLYSLLGRGAADPLRATGANFLIAMPFGLVLAFALNGGTLGQISEQGLILAILSGAVTSGLGYALWYRVLPHLAPSMAAVAQLSVPALAILAGVLVIGEGVTPDLLIGTALVFAGIALALSGSFTPHLLK